MRLTALRPLIWTEDLQGTIELYSGVLGFKLFEANDEWGWASLGIDDVHIMLARPNEHTPYEKITFTGSFYFTTDDVEAMRAKVDGKARLCYDIETFDWGMREFLFTTTTATRCSLGRKCPDNT